MEIKRNIFYLVNTRGFMSFSAVFVCVYQHTIILVCVFTCVCVCVCSEHLFYIIALKKGNMSGFKYDFL